MSGNDDSSFEELPLNLVRQIDLVARRAERLWRQGAEARAEDFLNEVPLQGRSVLLEELLLLEFDANVLSGKQSSGDDLLRRFPNDQAVIQRVLESRDRSPASLATSGCSEEDGARFPHIPDYRIERQLGRGAMGVVYLARQVKLNRLVALKLVAAGIDSSQASAIIRSEAEAIARLRHPNIVQVFDIGAIGHEPYLALEFVDGISLRELLADGSILPHPAALLMERIASAIHHAHAHGIIHRDLKPANILLTRSADQIAAPDPNKLTGVEKGTAPDSRNGPSGTSHYRGQSPLPLMIPKVTDFGLAKVLDALHIQTHSGLLLGTPKYMSPEQAEGRSRDVGPSADIYGLGAVLFEMLTGQAPFESDSSLKLLQLISEREAQFPSQPLRRVPADLKAICLKCLEKSPARRYGSALELANDLQRFLHGFPVLARRPTQLDLLTKFIRRNRILSVSISLVVTTLFATSIIIAIYAVRESSARRRAEESIATVDALRRDERHQVYWANMHLAQQAWQGARVDHMRQYLLNAAPAELAEQGSDTLRRDNGPYKIYLPPKNQTSFRHSEDLRDFEWHYLWKLANAPELVLADHRDTANVVFSPDGQTIVSAGKKGNVRLFDANTGELQADLPGKGIVEALAISPDGKQLAVGFQDSQIFVWSLALKRIIHTLVGHEHPLRAIVFSPDGSQLVSGDEIEKVIAWSADDGQPLWSVAEPELYVTDLSYDHSGGRVAVGCGGGKVFILDTSSGQKQQTIDAHSSWLTGVAFSPNDQRLATSSEDRTAKVWNLADGSLAIKLVGHKDWLTGIAYSPDGRTIGTSSRDGTVKLWDAESGRQRINLIGHSNWVVSLCFSPDSHQVASVSIDSTVCLWRPDPHWEARTLASRNASVTSMAYGQRSKAMYIADASGKVIICDVLNGTTLREFEAHAAYINDIKLSPNEIILATASHDGSIKVWNAETGKELHELRGHTAEIAAIAITSDNQRLISASYDGTLIEWDLSNGIEIHQLPLHASQIALALSPDGRLLASSGTKKVQLWDTSNWKEVMVLSGHSHVISILAFSQDGRILASGGTDRTICLWEADSGALLHRLVGHANNVTSLSFNQSGRRLVSSSQDGTSRIWDTSSGYELLTLNQHTDMINCVIYDPHGNFIATASHDQTVKLVEIATGH